MACYTNSAKNVLILGELHYKASCPETDTEINLGSIYIFINSHLEIPTIFSSALFNISTSDPVTTSAVLL